MTISIHQPHFLPWLGYLNKVFRSDVFVWLHTVQYRKNYFQNRTKIKNPLTDQPHWLTVPVRASLNDQIDEVGIANSAWARKAVGTIEQFYKKSPFFEEFYEEMTHQFNAANSLEEVNWKTFQFLMTVLQYPGRVIRAGDLNALSEDPNERLIEICKKLKADKYIAGRGGKNYVDVPRWTVSKIEVVFQEFHPEGITYHQLGSSFVPGLSVIDCLFNEGAEKTRELILAAWSPD